MGEIIAISTSAEERDPSDRRVIDAFASKGCNLTVISRGEIAENLQRLEAADGVVGMGTPLSYSKKTAEALTPYFQFLKNGKVKKFLGFCAPMQAVGLVFDGEMQRNEEIESGPAKVQVLDNHSKDPLFRDLGKCFDLHSNHRASVDISRAPNILHLARSLPRTGVSYTGCEAQIIRIADTSYYGVQSHPEGGHDGLQLIGNFLDLEPEQLQTAPAQAEQNDGFDFHRRDSGLIVARTVLPELIVPPTNVIEFPTHARQLSGSISGVNSQLAA